MLVTTLAGFFLVWRARAEWGLDYFSNARIRRSRSEKIEVQTDGVVPAEQVRRWSGVKPGQNLLALDLARVKR